MTEMPDHERATLGEEVGEATGGISGVLVGAGIGSAAGPVGLLIGGIAGAIGGWWAGRAVADAASDLTHEDDEYYRTHFAAAAGQPKNLAYEDARGAYFLGQIAAHNPNFTSREFTEVEPELRRGWAARADAHAWEHVRDYAAEGFSRGRSRLDDAAHRAQEQREGLTPGQRDERRP